MITAYNNPKNLDRLLSLLDDDRNEIFLHYDIKAGEEAKKAVRAMKHARLHMVPSMNVKWGDVSQIECTLRAMHAALKWDWDYIHYVTESDMLLKTMDEVDSIFAQSSGMEFVDFEPGNYEFAQYKCQVHHLFTPYNSYRKSALLKALNHGFAKLQWKLGVRRHSVDYKHGSAYFSITKSFAAYIDSRAAEILKHYRHTIGADEVWLQTLCAQSPFLEKVKYYETKGFMGNLRYIDWKRRNGSSPYTFRDTDWEELKGIADNTQLCIARKFSNDSPVAESLKDYLTRKGRGV